MTTLPHASSHNAEKVHNVPATTAASYSLGEEIAHSVSHGVGALCGIAALVLLIIVAMLHGGGARLAAALLMGIAFIVEYLMSTLYHAISHEKAKRILRVFDHSGVYLLIAGCYAPFSLVTLADHGGLILTIVVWTIALGGIIAEWVLRQRQRPWQTALVYVAMGWCVLPFVGVLYQLLHPVGFWLLVAGGLSHTIGAVFYVFKKIPYLHFVFHLFTLAGSVFIFFSALFFVV